MKKIVWIMAGVLCLLVVASSILIFISLQKPALPRELPWLHVEGNRIVDESGKVVILRGVSIADPYWLSWENHFTEADFAGLSQNWHAKIIRVPVHPGLWMRDPNYIYNFLDPVVSWGKKYGMYVIIDWHAIGNPVTGEPYHSMWENYEPWYGNPYDSRLSLAVEAWHTIAERYKDNSWVLYDIFKEPTGLLYDENGYPTGLTWGEWRRAAENLIDVVRSHNPKALIFVGGIDFAYDLRGVSTDPIQRSNIVYTSHTYPNHVLWEDYWGFLSTTLPVFASEWGYDSEAPAEHYYGSRDNFGTPFLNYIENRVAGWTTWCWHPDWGPRMLEDWDYTPTDFGQLVKEVLVAGGSGGR